MGKVTSSKVRTGNPVAATRDRPWCTYFSTVQDHKKCGSYSSSVTLFSVNGRWSSWSAWTKCSKACGNGTKTRLRTCTNPPPMNGGKCVGPSKQMKPCLEKRCPGLCNSVTLAFRFHERLADQVSGQVSTKAQ